MLDQQEYESLIIASKSDQASLNIANNLIESHGFKREDDSGSWEVYKKANLCLLLGQKECIYVEPVDVPFGSQRIVFVSKHRSNVDRPALTVHTTGNLGSEAKYGGHPGELSWVDPDILKTALTSMRRELDRANSEMVVTMEATHHGPTSFTVPVCFVEVGSTPKEFTNPDLGRMAADATMAALSSSNRSTPTVGFGGTHYSAKHTRTNMTSGEFAVGHLVPKHAFEAGIQESVLKSTFDKTMGGCKTALVDWKGLKGVHRQWLVDRLSDGEIEVVRC